MRIRLVAGRNFSAVDQPTGPPVAIVNETLARRLWPGESAVGKRVQLGCRDAQALEVSSPGESHPEALSEPYLNVSAHTAPAMEPRRTPICQCAHNFGSRREIRATQCVARRKCPRSFCISDRPNGPASDPVDASADRAPSDNTARSIEASPGSIGLNIRDRSSIALSLRRCRFQLRISLRIDFTALSETAGTEVDEVLPLRFFDLRGRKV